jgi:hypothetical protein
MINEVSSVNPGEAEDDIDVLDDAEFTDTVVLAETGSTDNVGDASVEINVEELIADIEKSKDEVSARKKEVRRRLEELAESKDLDDTFAIEFDED